MTFKADKREDFEQFFEQHKRQISGFEGCKQVDLYNDAGNDNCYFTISRWSSEEALENYRHSSFFSEVWPQVKQWFAAKTEAYTLIKK